MRKQLILGCMRLGGTWNNEPLASEDIIQAEQAVEAALSVGIDTFDHADFYMLGKAEEVFGHVLANHPSLRSQIKVQTKAGIMIGKGPLGSSIYNNSKDYLISQVESSLKRLQTDYLDHFLIHRPDALMNGKEIAEAFRYLEENGLVRSFGVSNMSVNQIELIQHYWGKPLIANQIQLSLGHSTLLDMGADVNTYGNFSSGIEGMFEYSQINDLVLQAYSPLDGGRYTKPLEKVEEKDQEVAKKLVQYGEKYNVSPNVIAISWLLQLPIPIHPIIGTTNPERIKDSAKALSTELTREEWYELWITARNRPLP